jgi:hypothetical protein
MPQTPTPVTDLPLRDIHLPADIGWWPLAYGWWLLLGLILLGALLILMAIRYRSRRRLRRLALQQLEALDKLPAEQLAAPLSRLLRQAAVNHFSAAETAGLIGQDWLEFLDRPLKDKGFSQGVGHCLLDAPYRPEEPIDKVALLDLCRCWLKKLPPQPVSFWRGR